MIQAPSSTFIINSTFAPYLMLPHTPAPAVAPAAASGQIWLQDKGGCSTSRSLSWALSPCRWLCTALLWLCTATARWKYLQGSTVEEGQGLISEQQRARGLS